MAEVADKGGGGAEGAEEGKEVIILNVCVIKL